jgi:hypothetical protein
MDGGESPKQNEDIGTSDRPLSAKLKGWLTTLLFLSAVLSFFLLLLRPPVLKEATWEWIQFGSTGTLFFVAILSIRNWCALKWTCWLLRIAVPWFILVLLLLSATTLFVVRSLRAKPPEPPRLSPISITFDLAHAKIFNSSEDPGSGHTERLKAWGSKRGEWEVHGPKEASFSYKVNPALAVSPNASAGGYILFYANPVDRRVFHKILFFLQSSETCAGKADLGVRLAVDDPRDGAEDFTYELNSLKRARQVTIGKDWEGFEIGFNEFRPLYPQTGPLPPDLNENTINKVAFFVDNDIAKRCPKNTLLIRDISLQP